MNVEWNLRKITQTGALVISHFLLYDCVAEVKVQFIPRSMKVKALVHFQSWSIIIKTTFSD